MSSEVIFTLGFIVGLLIGGIVSMFYNEFIEKIKELKGSDKVSKEIEKLEYTKVLYDGTDEPDRIDEYYLGDWFIGIKGDDETNIRLKIINKINKIIDKINELQGSDKE